MPETKNATRNVCRLPECVVSLIDSCHAGEASAEACPHYNPRILVAVPLLSSECDGCGEVKTYTESGEIFDTDSLVCCDECWKSVPDGIREAFKKAAASFDGPAPEEVALRAYLRAKRQYGLCLTTT